MSIALCCVDIIEFLSHEAIFLLFKHCILVRILSLVYSETANVFKNSFYEFGIRVDSCEFTEEISNCSRSLPSCDACLFERRSIKVDILSCVHGVGRYHAPSILLQTIITVNHAFIFHLIRG
jgi:hypothetical protein